MISLESRIKQQAGTLGFELVGIAPAVEADGFAHLEDWLAQGFAGDMEYMHRYGEAHRHPQSILPNVKSVVMVGINYKQAAGSGPQAANTGHISCYAAGADYHDVLRGKLKALFEWIQSEVPGTRGRAVIDTAPLLERDFARRAGLGWFGKNTMLIDKRFGSFFFIGALLLDLALQADPPFETAHCGSCTRCLDACPTDAFVAPYQLDARRCISYLTIELRGAIAEELRPLMDDWIFGCDVCQDVCPWNRKSPVGQDAALQSSAADLRVSLIEIVGLSEEAFRARYRHTPLWRTKRAGLVRNAAIALGNVGDETALPALEHIRDDPAPTIREAAAWAITQIRERSDRNFVRTNEIDRFLAIEPP
jgi:epoxyqueuosine reductase